MFLSKRQNGIYYLFINDEHSGKRKVVSCMTKNKSKALKFLATYNSQSEIKIKKSTSPKFTLHDLQTEVLKFVSDNLRRSTGLIYIRVFKHMFKIIGNKQLKQITTNDIENYKSVRLRVVNKTTVNIEFTTIKAIFNIGIRFNLLESNPCKSVKKFTIPQKERLCFNDLEISLILSKAKTSMFQNIIRFALLTGCRLNEICNVQWNDIKFEENVINIFNKEDFKTKTGKLRQIPISVVLHKQLKVMFEGELAETTQNELIIENDFSLDNYIFSLRSGEKLRIDYVSATFKKLLRRSKLPEKYHFHCLRHTFITNLIKSGVNINYVKELAGHSDIHTTMRYIHISTDDLRDAVNKINI